MRTGAQANDDWIDGFLFVANRLILDFLNTKPVLAEGPTELLPDAQALERWLIASGIVTSPRIKTLIRSWRHSSDAFLKDLVSFRERLREAVLQIESGSAPSDEFLKEVNARLLQHPLHTALRRRDRKLVRETLFAPQKPADFWAPIIDSAADLLAETESSRI